MSSHNTGVTQAQICILSPALRYPTLPQCCHSASPCQRIEKVVIARKRKHSWSVQVTGDFDNELLSDIFDELDSEEIQLAFEVQDVLQERLIKADVNAKAREIIWEDGHVLSLRESIKRVGEEYPQYPLAILERQFTVWLEHFPPESYSQAQLDEYEALSDKWLDDYAREFGFDR